MDSVPPIYASVHDTGAAFIALEAALRQPESLHYTAQLSAEMVKDEFDRFKIWSGNIAAHLKGGRSLENRLRDAAHLKEETHNLLTALHDNLQTCKSAGTNIIRF
jgi:hypothetical protein